MKEHKKDQKKERPFIGLLNENAVSKSKDEFRLSHFTAILIFFCMAIEAGVAVILETHWPITATASALGFRSILPILVTRTPDRSPAE